METRSKHQRLWASRRAQGLCGQCGVVPSQKFSRCLLCRGFVNEWRKGWYHRPEVKSHERKKRAQWRETHREKLRLRGREWYWANHQKALNSLRASYQKRKAA